MVRLRCLVMLGTLAATCHADVRLPKILSTHAVLQQQSDVRIWGWAEPGEAVRVSGSWLQAPAMTTADANGYWETRLHTLGAGGPHVIVIQGNNRVVLDELMFGEVWLASGQSNMEMPVVPVSGAYTGIQNAEREADDADEPNIVLFQVGNFSSDKPLEEVEAGIEMYGIPPAACRWQPCTSESVRYFSSTAYFFARSLQHELKVPIGIIDASWGGTAAEAWTPAEGLQQLGDVEALKLAAEHPQAPDQKIPTRLYNGMIHPLRKMTIKGVIWYQGEGNTSRPEKYEALFTTMIAQWRKAWGSEFPFYFVQLAPFQYNGVNAAFLREAQQKSMALPRTGMAVTMDIGNLTDIHPKNKQEVGRRLALWALAKDYGQDVECAGPTYRKSMTEGGIVQVLFDHVGNGLQTTDGQPPSHFQLAGADRTFYDAQARISNGRVFVSSPDVPEPLAVRYAFSSDATPNLVNSFGLPAAPFRSDHW